MIDGFIEVDYHISPMQQATGPKISNLAQIMREHINFATDEGGRLYYYYEGVYRPGAEKCIAIQYQAILKKWQMEAAWKPNFPTNIVQYLTTNSPKLWQKPPLYTLNLLNGLLDIETNTKIDHNPDFLSTTQIPINFDSSCTCNHWDRFLDTIFPEGRELMYQVLAWLLVPHTGLQKTILLLGEGSNGKGTFLRAVDAICGESNVSHLSLHQLEEDKFSRVRLMGKLVNIFGDLPLKTIQHMTFFKALTGEDTLNLEYKFGESFSYKPFCRLIFSSNAIPSTDDGTKGYQRRWLILPFTQVFNVNPSVGRRLEEDLTSPEELSGLLNILIPKIPQILTNGFQIPEAITNIVSNYMPVPDNVRSWAETYLLEDHEGYIESALLYRFFTRTCEGIPTDEGFSATEFVGFIRAIYPSIQVSKQKWVVKNTTKYSEKREGKNIRCHVGIKFSEKGVELAARLLGGSTNSEEVQ